MTATRISFFIFLAFSAANISAQPTIVRQSNGSYSSYSNLNIAHDQAVDGDTLYLSGGSFSWNGGAWSKRIVVIGAGYPSDSTLATSGSLVTSSAGFSIAANTPGNTVFEGIYFSAPQFVNGSTPFTDVYFKRCIVTAQVLLAAESNLWFEECWFLATVNLQQSVGGNFRHCIFRSELYAMTGGSVERSVFLGSMGSAGGFNLTSVTFTDSYVGNYLGNYVNNCVFINCAGPHGSPSYCTLYGNTCMNTFGNLNAVDVFENYLGVDSGFLDNSFQLLTGTPLIGGATDGTDMGLYGGDEPFKPGGVPSNPHIQFKQISGQTNPDGSLPVHIKAAAQPY